MDRAVALGVAAAALGAAVLRARVARDAMLHVGGDADFTRVNDELDSCLVRADGVRWRGDDVLVVRRRATGQLWAICDTCPHAGYPLHEGDIEDLAATSAHAAPLGAPVVSCPAHAYVFDLQRGTCLSAGSAARCPPAPVYTAQMRGGRLFLSAEPVAGGSAGASVLSVVQANAVQLEMVDRALTRKYGTSI